MKYNRFRLKKPEKILPNDEHGRKSRGRSKSTLLCFFMLVDSLFFYNIFDLAFYFMLHFGMIKPKFWAFH